jgi:uncharacterized membrane protein
MAALAAPAHAQSITTICTATGNRPVVASDMTPDGQIVVGTYVTPDNLRGFRWSAPLGTITVGRGTAVQDSHASRVSWAGDDIVGYTNTNTRGDLFELMDWVRR